MALEVLSLEIPALKLITPKRWGDDRGFFSETYNRRLFAEHGLALEFLQDNHTFSARAGTVRGLHYQLPPHAQDKLIRVIRGAILDVAVDLRRGSPTYGRHVAVELSAANWAQMLVPIGFAHGFCTLTPDVEVLYKVTNYYAPEHDRGILWNDPELGIAWPVGAAQALLSDKDRRLPRLGELTEPPF